MENPFLAPSLPNSLSCYATIFPSLFPATMVNLPTNFLSSANPHFAIAQGILFVSRQYLARGNPLLSSSLFVDGWFSPTLLVAPNYLLLSNLLYVI